MTLGSLTRLPPISVRGQLVLWNVLTLTLLLTALGVVARLAAVSAIMHSVDQNLQDRAHLPPHGGHPPGDRPPFGDRPPQGGPPPNGLMPPPGGGPSPPPPPPQDDVNRTHLPRTFDRHGQPTGRPSGPAWDPAALAAALHGRTTFSIVTVAGEPLRVLTKPARPQGAIQAAYPLTDVEGAIAGLDRALLLLIPVALLGAWAGGAGLTARVLRPVRQITQAAARMGDTASARLPAQGRDEFAQMAATFNGLLERLDASFQQQARLLEQQRRFTADASHELKTPLTVIQGTASQMRHGPVSEEECHQAMAEIAEAAGGMACLVQDLLLLARSDEGRMGRSRITVLAREVLARAASRLPPNAPPVAMRMDDEALAFRGNEDELVRLFANLIQNAAQATPADGRITVAARQQGPDVVVTVTDTGAGIAPEHLPHLGERFYRVDSARARRDGGTGLGLSICRSIVEAHGGTWAFASAPGQGTTVTVTLKGG